MNKVFAIIGAICFAVAIGLGYFADFPGDSLVAIAVAAFGLAALIVGAIKTAKEKEKFTWKTIVCIVLAVIGGVLCCIGGLAENIFATIAGAVIALLTVIFGVLYAKKEADK